MNYRVHVQHTDGRRSSFIRDFDFGISDDARMAAARSYMNLGSHYDRTATIIRISPTAPSNISSVGNPRRNPARH